MKKMHKEMLRVKCLLNLPKVKFIVQNKTYDTQIIPNWI